MIACDAASSAALVTAPSPTLVHVPLVRTTIPAHNTSVASDGSLAVVGRRPLLFQGLFFLEELDHREETAVVSQSEALALLRAFDGADGHDAGEARSLGLEAGFDGFVARLPVPVAEVVVG